jgi:hypothetical protein
MKVYITKYALSTGIIETDDAEICSNIISGDMISSKNMDIFTEMIGTKRRKTQF